MTVRLKGECDEKSIEYDSCCFYPLWMYNNGKRNYR